MPWINHPATDSPVSFWRWLKYQVGDWMERKGSRMVDHALYPERCEVCGQRKYYSRECDHVPF